MTHKFCSVMELHGASYWFEKGHPEEWYCDVCFTGEYPTRLVDAERIDLISV